MADDPLSTTSVNAGRDNREQWRHELELLYRQQENLDETLHRLTEFFFAASAVLLGFLVQRTFQASNSVDLITSSSQRVQQPALTLFLVFGGGVLGYAASLAILLVSLKGYVNWDINQERVRELERLLQYSISENYSRLKQEFFISRISIAKIRVIFNLLVTCVWLIVSGGAIFLIFHTRLGLTMPQSLFFSILVMLSVAFLTLFLYIGLSAVWGWQEQRKWDHVRSEIKPIADQNTELDE